MVSDDLVLFKYRLPTAVNSAMNVLFNPDMRPAQARLHLPLKRCRHAGFTLIELMVVVAVIAAILGIAIPYFQDYSERSKRAAAVSDMMSIMSSIERYLIRTNEFPPSLDDLDGVPAADPWGHSYEYLRINGVPAPNRGRLRKDKNLVPLNSDYDLYSKGKDGQSQMPLTARQSSDDIVRAGNGAFVGLAADH